MRLLVTSATSRASVSCSRGKGWAAGTTGPCYAIDDQSALRVIGDTIDVISEGHWRAFAPQHPTEAPPA